MIVVRKLCKKRYTTKYDEDDGLEQRLDDSLIDSATKSLCRARSGYSMPSGNDAFICALSCATHRTREPVRAGC